MPRVDVQYLKTDKRNGSLIYRRRVPKGLEAAFPQTEIVKVLGRTMQEALVAYGPFHQRIEHLRALAKNGVAGLSPAEQRQRLVVALQSWGADPFGPGQTDAERTWRQEAAAKLVAPYENLATGTFEDVPPAVDAEATALLAGVATKAPGPTITDAFKFYLAENAKPIPEQRKKQEQRYARAERHLIAAVGSDKLVADLTREDARKWRDMRIAAGVLATTVGREKNDINAVIATAVSELDAGGVNPFAKLKLPQATVSRQEERDPLPIPVIEGVYAALAKKADLLAIWTLMDFTGARPSEIRQLKLSEIVLADPIPHIVIQERDDKTVKTSWSIRQVPLIGAALTAARAVVEQQKGRSEFAFPHYASEGGMDRLSKALTLRIRTLTTDPKHVPYSLRHNMKDRMREAEVFSQTQLAIEGHALGAGQEASYGKGVSLQKKQKALLDALAGYRGTAATDGSQAAEV